ncbi:SDR family NAD(P)-dependent oxidoreductase [Aquihabitans sp. McL0605]|uniref:SDR family NAD(P)-dependent oxidoreductase n=1 Tax=Aquihabitans sp. McL0605 TaxID=3415671 RepID=UPI003CEDD499
MGLLDGKVAVITGAGSGMGKASVDVFVREGATVVAVDITGRQDDTAAEVGAGVRPVQCDVSKEAEVEAMIATAVDEFGRLDILMNVAGIADALLMSEMTMEHYDRILDVDLRGVVLGMKYGIQAMQKTGGGSIINFSSVGGMNGAGWTGAYTMAKHAVIGATKVAAIENGEHGIRINAICPGFIVTGMSAGAEDLPGIPEKSVFNRVGQAHEVAEVAAFVASDRASFMTGAIIPVDGGWTAKLA